MPAFMQCCIQAMIDWAHLNLLSGGTLERMDGRVRLIVLLSFARRFVAAVYQTCRRD
jgi:hypothetical protein